MVEERDWAVRELVYQHLVATGESPPVNVIAEKSRLSVDEVQDALERLDARHALFLDPNDRSLRIVNPFSAVPTSFRVVANGVTYWGNCAWDALGIPAALHTDASIEARYAEDDTRLHLEVTSGSVQGDDAIVHFPLPFRSWYDDLIFT